MERGEGAKGDRERGEVEGGEEEGIRDTGRGEEVGVGRGVLLGLFAQRK